MGWLIAFVALALAGLALWRTWRMNGEVARLKRDLYYADTRLKHVSREIEEAIGPLRAQVARLAAGLPVSPDLIRAGQRYLSIDGDAARGWLVEPAGDRLAIIDVRTPKEFAARRIPGAKLVPFEELDRRYADEIPATAERVLLYCESGERSRMACDFLSSKGYANLFNLQNGLQGWRGETEGEGEVRFIQLERRR